MIFCSKNEKGELACDLICVDRKDLTRRVKPEPVGVVRANCPGRGMFAKCRILIVGCVSDAEFWSKVKLKDMKRVKEMEAHREGFESWGGLQDWFVKKYGEYPVGLYRIEFRRV